MAGVSIDLEYPLTIDGREVRQLNMRRPNVGDLRIAQEAAGANVMLYELTLIQNLLELTSDQLQAMDAADYYAAQEVLRGFTTPGRKKSAPRR